MKKIEELRKEIEKTDEAIVKKLAERRKLSVKIGEIKAEMEREIFDASREAYLMGYYNELSQKYDLQSEFVKELFELIIAQSREAQKNA